MLGIAGQAHHLPYSIASAPEETAGDGHLEFLVKIDDTGWGPHLSGLRRGAKVMLHGPFGGFVFPAAPAERQFLFVAGGTGIAPLRSMISHALRRDQPGQLRLLYSARTPHDFAYLQELKRYARAGLLQIGLTATREVPPRWRGERGRITVDRLARLLDSTETLCFVCGPAQMVDDVPRMLQALGVERERIRIEEW